MLEEKRLFPRINIVCKISTIFDNRLLVFNTHTENVSEGGIRVILEEKLNNSAIVDLELFLPNKDIPVKGKGQVAWTLEMDPVKIRHRLFYTGIKFIEISDQNKEQIREFVKSRLAQSS